MHTSDLRAGEPSGHAPAAPWPAGPPPCAPAAGAPAALPSPAARCCWCAAGCPRCTAPHEGCRRPPAASGTGKRKKERKKYARGQGVEQADQGWAGLAGCPWPATTQPAAQGLLASVAGSAPAGLAQGRQGWLPACDALLVLRSATTPAGNAGVQATGSGLAHGFWCPCCSWGRAFPWPRPACACPGPTLDGTRVLPSTAAATASSHCSSARPGSVWVCVCGGG